MGEHKQNPVAVAANVKYDAATSAWFGAHPGEETTVACCQDCGLYYKPELGRRCKRRRKAGDGNE